MTLGKFSPFINAFLLLFGIAAISSDKQDRLSPEHWQRLDRSGRRPDARHVSYGSGNAVFITRDMIRGMQPGANLADFDEDIFDDDDDDDGAVTRSRRRRRTKREESVSDAISSNITRILEGLLKDYDKTERPGFKTGNATNVVINVHVKSMGPISEEDMNYSMDCYFRQYWRDERLSFTGLKKDAHSDREKIDKLSLNVKMLEKIWKPDTYFYNGLSSYLHTITRPNKLLRISEHGDITYSMRLTIKARCPMMLRSFPMDWQTCPLVIGSFAYTTDQLRFDWKSVAEPVEYDKTLKLSQFEKHDTYIRGLNFSRNETKGRYSVLQIVISLRRHTGYFLIQIYLPCTLLVVLSWVGFFLNREATSDRVGLGITTVLTLSTISLDSRTSLPKVHYATGLDWFLVCSFAYCIATLLEFAAVHYFTKVGSGEVFSITEDLSLLPDPYAAQCNSTKRDLDCVKEKSDVAADQDDDEVEWEDVDVSEECGQCGGTGVLARPTQRIGLQLSFEEDLPEFRGGSGGEGGGGEASCPNSSRLRALHLPGCSKFEPFNTTSSGKLAMNGGRAAQTACSDCSGHSHVANNRSVVTVASSFNPVFNVDLGGGGHGHINGDLRNRGVLKSLVIQDDAYPSAAPDGGFLHDFPADCPLPPPPPPLTSQHSFGDNTFSRSTTLTSTHLPNSVSLPSLKSAGGGIQNGRGGGGDLRHRGSRLAGPVTLQQEQQVSNHAGDRTSCMYQFLYCILSDQSYRRKRQIEAARQGSTNSTSKIDSAARILFPLSFGLFNFAYWYSYLSSHKAFTWDDHMLKGNVLS